MAGSAVAAIGKNGSSGLARLVPALQRRTFAAPKESPASWSVGGAFESTASRGDGYPQGETNLC
jgi:hypothetical protein